MATEYYMHSETRVKTKFNQKIIISTKFTQNHYTNLCCDSFKKFYMFKRFMFIMWVKNCRFNFVVLHSQIINSFVIHLLIYCTMVHLIQKSLKLSHYSLYILTTADLQLGYFLLYDCTLNF